MSKNSLDLQLPDGRVVKGLTNASAVNREIYKFIRAQKYKFVCTNTTTSNTFEVDYQITTLQLHSQVLQQIEDSKSKEALAAFEPQAYRSLHYLLLEVQALPGATYKASRYASIRPYDKLIKADYLSVQIDQQTKERSLSLTKKGADYLAKAKALPVEKVSLHVGDFEAVSKFKGGRFGYKERAIAQKVFDAWRALELVTEMKEVIKPSQAAAPNSFRSRSDQVFEFQYTQRGLDILKKHATKFIIHIGKGYQAKQSDWYRSHNEHCERLIKELAVCVPVTERAVLLSKVNNDVVQLLKPHLEKSDVVIN